MTADRARLIQGRRNRPRGQPREVGVSQPQVSYLADKPEFIPALAEGTRAEYLDLWPDRTVPWRIARYRAHMNRESLPIGWVIHSGDTVFGTVALRALDFAGFEHLTPWLGGLYVFPEFRGGGLGARLCSKVETEVARRGVETLYLGTFNRRAWFGSMGWDLLKTGTLHDQHCDIMCKRLAVATTS